MHIGLLKASAFLPGVCGGVCSFHLHPLGICYRALKAKLFQHIGKVVHCDSV